MSGHWSRTSIKRTLRKAVSTQMGESLRHLTKYGMATVVVDVLIRAKLRVLTACPEGTDNNFENLPICPSYNRGTADTPRPYTCRNPMKRIPRLNISEAATIPRILRTARVLGVYMYIYMVTPPP